MAFYSVNPGDVILAAHINDAIKQGHIPFSSETTRNAALPAATTAAGTMTYLIDQKVTQRFNGTTWVTVAMKGESVPIFANLTAADNFYNPLGGAPNGTIIRTTDPNASATWLRSGSTWARGMYSAHLDAPSFTLGTSSQIAPFNSVTNPLGSYLTFPSTDNNGVTIPVWGWYMVSVLASLNPVASDYQLTMQLYDRSSSSVFAAAMSHYAIGSPTVGASFISMLPTHVGPSSKVTVQLTLKIATSATVNNCVMNILGPF